MRPDTLITMLRTHISGGPTPSFDRWDSDLEAASPPPPQWGKAVTLLQSCLGFRETTPLLQCERVASWENTPPDTAQLLSIFLWALNQEKLPEPPLTKKEAALICHRLNTHDAPYYPRYVVSSRLFAPLLFQSLKERLATPGVTLYPGHSQQQRIDAITPFFPGGSTLVDIGCGKATYLRILAEHYFSVIGFEKDEATRKEAAYVLRRQRVAQAKLFTSFDTARQIPHGAHVLMTEVMEHMPKPAAQEILSHLGRSRAQLVVLTAPNRSFNKHYGLSPDKFRHWDHHWEPDETEFREVVQHSFGEQWECAFSGIGDAVDDVSATLLCSAKQSAIKTLW